MGVRLALLATAGSAVIAGAAAAYLSRGDATADVPRAPVVAAAEIPGVCPWRDPEGDLRRYFPGAGDWRPERRSLAARWRSLRDRLGRTPSPEDAVLDRCLVFDAHHGPAGRVLLRRVRGEDGAIELVVAVNEAGRVLGTRLQRDRETPAAAKVLHSPEWLGQFEQRTARDCPAAAVALRSVPAAAQPSARAVAEGLRTLLILDDEAGAAAPARDHDHAHAGGA